MSGEQAPSKRERHKQRRDAKQAERHAQATKARRRRLLAVGLVGVLLIAGIGVVVANRMAANAERNAVLAAAAERLDEVGCTPIEAQPDLGQGHLATTPDALAAAPPSTLYPDRPASSGSHYPSWVLTGVYEQQIDERILVHNLEHGYVVFYYSPDADSAEIEELKTFASEQIDAGYPKIVVAPYPDPLPDDAQFVTVAWGQRQLCTAFDQAVATAFLQQHHNAEAAPERYLPPHRNEGDGVDPTAEDGPLLLPPLDDDGLEESPAPTMQTDETPASLAPGEGGDEGGQG